LLEARLLLVTGEAGGRHRRRCLDAPPRFDAGSRIVQQRPRRRRAARRRLSPCCYHGVVEDPWTPDASCPLGRRDRPSSPPPPPAPPPRVPGPLQCPRHKRSSRSGEPAPCPDSGGPL